MGFTISELATSRNFPTGVPWNGGTGGTAWNTCKKMTDLKYIYLNLIYSAICSFTLYPKNNSKTRVRTYNNHIGVLKYFINTNFAIFKNK